MGHQLGGHQVGLDHIERRRQDVGDDVLVVDDLAEQRTADPQALDREQSQPAGQDHPSRERAAEAAHDAGDLHLHPSPSS